MKWGCDPQQRRDFGKIGYYERCACGGTKTRLSEDDDHAASLLQQAEGDSYWRRCPQHVPINMFRGSAFYPSDNRWHDTWMPSMPLRLNVNITFKTIMHRY